MQFTSENIDDIRRYYIGSYVKFKETGDILYHLTSVNNFFVEGRSQKGDILKLYLDDQHPYEIEYVLPHKSYYQYGNSAAQLFRIPAKQYQRGIGPENTEIRALVSGEFMKVNLDFASLCAFVDKQMFYSLSDAIVADANTSCVLTPRMAYDRNCCRIYMDLTPIATVIPEKNKVVVEKKVFMDDVVEFLSKQDEKFEVTH